MTQDKPTIEDVLKKYIYKNIEGFGDGLTVAGAEAAMTEWASLNRQGWTRVDKTHEDLKEWVMNEGVTNIPKKVTEYILKLESDIFHSSLNFDLALRRIGKLEEGLKEIANNFPEWNPTEQKYDCQILAEKLLNIKNV